MNKIQRMFLSEDQRGKNPFANFFTQFIERLPKNVEIEKCWVEKGKEFIEKNKEVFD